MAATRSSSPAVATAANQVKRELVYDRYGELFAGLYEPSDLSWPPVSAQSGAPSGPSER